MWSRLKQEKQAFIPTHGNTFTVFRKLKQIPKAINYSNIMFGVLKEKELLLYIWF